MNDNTITAWQVETALRLAYGIDVNVNNGPFTANSCGDLMLLVYKKGITFTEDGGINIHEAYKPI